MSKISATADDFKKMGLIEISDGTFKKASQVLKNQVSKEKQLLRLSKALQQAEPNNGIVSNRIDHFTLPEKPKTSENKKILNATKTTIDGITFDSKLEGLMYSLLTSFKIPFEMKKEFQIQEPFVYNGEKIRAITIIPDFYLPEHKILIDTKGHQTSDNKIKIKMLKFGFYGRSCIETFICPEILLPKDKEECQAIINKLIK